MIGISESVVLLLRIGLGGRILAEHALYHRVMDDGGCYVEQMIRYSRAVSTPWSDPGGRGKREQSSTGVDARLKERRSLVESGS